MHSRIRRSAALAAASVPVAALLVVAGLSQSLYASNGSCFRPTLDLFVQASPTSSATTGQATAALAAKPPFILEGATTADGFLDADAGVSAANALGAISRFWTPQCSGWSYGWSANGTVVGQLKSITSKTWPGSATATCSFSGTAAGDLNPCAHDAKVASSATQGGGSVTIGVGVSPPSVSYSISHPSSSQTVSPSTNPAGDVKTLFDGPKINVGAGAETVVVVNLAQEHNASAYGGGFGLAPHVRKSSASTGGYVGAAVLQDIYARSPAGVDYGMEVHVQTGSFRDAHRDPDTGTVAYGPWHPAPTGIPGEPSGPDVRPLDDPPPPPNPSDRDDNDGGLHRAK